MAHFIDFSLLKRNRSYALLFSGRLVSFLGTMITGVALPYQIYHATHSTLMVGLLSLCQLIPLLITAPLGGVLADRHHRQRLLLMSEMTLAIGCLLLIWNATFAKPNILFLFIIAPIMSGMTGIYRPAFDSLIQQVVDKKELSQVSTLSTLTRGICMIGGPAASGLILAHFGLTVAYLADFLTYLISLMTLFMLRDISPRVLTGIQTAWKSLKEGVIYAASRQELLGSYLVDFMAMVFGMPMALFPAIADSHGSPSVLGFLYATPAVGALVISLWSGWTHRIARLGLAISLSAAAWGVCIVVFGLAHSLWTSLFFLGLAGSFDALSGIFRSTLWNHTIPNQLRGRLAGLEMVSYLSGPRIGDAEAGLVAAQFGIPFSIVSGGVLCVLAVAVCYYSLPKFRHYREISS